ncbi:DNA polymerase/3'-5' exonuclease PolX [Spiribacter sp. 221]|uniref:DNA polymerase/3'-5' exonuclease PolX n=1 Tax=Spiribacter onubensis TaxID=3122420 RepID=UPI00349FBEEE
MPVRNRDIANAFETLADLLEIGDANPFRVRAYRNAASTVRDQSRPIRDMLAAGEDLTELPGIGDDLAGQIARYVETGHLARLDAATDELPAGLTALLDINGIGPRRAHALYEGLGITSVDELADAARQKRVRTLSGFGEKTEQRILHEIERLVRHSPARTLLADAEEMAESLLAWIRRRVGVDQATIAGSYRRRRETVGDLDIVVSASDPAAVSRAVTRHEDVAEVISSGETRTTLRLRGGLQVDIRVVPHGAYGAAMHYFTGSRDHNIALRRRAQGHGWKLNEYGLFDDDQTVAGDTEESVYAALSLPWIPPELRENRGEIEAAENDDLPTLIDAQDIRGNLHTHTTATDGKASLEEMAEAARERGWEYLGISDHSRAVRVANGLDADRLTRQLDDIDVLNERLDDLVILKSCEVDILRDGSLDLPDTILERLDYVIGAIHGHLDLGRRAQTERLLDAMDHPLMRIIAHPTGRLIGTRRPMALDMDRLFEAAVRNDIALEINAQPKRLDLNDQNARAARDAGVMLVIGTDAHSPAQLDFMRYGVDQARRAWLSAGDVLNTRPVGGLRDLLARGRSAGG